MIWSDQEGEVVFWQQLWLLYVCWWTRLPRWNNFVRDIYIYFYSYEQRDARKARGTNDVKSSDPYNMEDIAMPLLDYINDPIAHEIIHNGATFQVLIHILQHFYLCSYPKCQFTNLIHRLQDWQTTLIYLNHMRFAIV